MSTPTIPFYQKPWFKAIVVIVIFGWTIFKLVMVYLINRYGGVIIDQSYAFVFVVGLLPLYGLIYCLYTIPSKGWKLIYCLTVFVAFGAVFVRTVITFLNHPQLALLMDTIVEMILTLMVYAIAIVFVYTLGWKVLLGILWVVLRLLSLASLLLMGLSLLFFPPFWDQIGDYFTDRAAAIARLLQKK